MYSSSYKSLEEIFILLNIEPYYLHITKEEYARVIEFKINQMENVKENYDDKVISESSDAFLQTMLFRHCHEQEDYENFFNSLKEIPSHIYQELRIKEYDNREISEYISKKCQENKLQTKMNEIYMRFRNHSKKENSLNHDAGLITGIEYLRQERDAWILTRDGTVHTYSVENTKMGDIPFAISLRALINLLCVNEGGIDIDSSNFRPLFSNFIKNDLMPFSDVFGIEDLTRMSEIETQVLQLPEEKIIELAKEINHQRFSEESDSKIAVTIQRKIQSYKIDVKDRLDLVETELVLARKEKGKAHVQQKLVEQNFKREKTKELKKLRLPKIKMKFIFRFIFQFFILIVSFLIIRFVIWNDYQNNLISVLIGIGVNIITGVIEKKYLWIPNYFKLIKKEESKIIKIVDSDWIKLNDGNCT